MLGGAGCECQGWAAAGQGGRATGSAAGLDVQGSPGEPAEQSGHSLGMHMGIFRSYIATCANLLELVN